MVSTIEGFHCIQDTSPCPQGVHNRRAPLYTEHFTMPPRYSQQRGSTVYAQPFMLRMAGKTTSGLCPPFSSRSKDTCTAPCTSSWACSACCRCAESPARGPPRCQRGSPASCREGFAELGDSWSGGHEQALAGGTGWWVEASGVFRFCK